MRPLLLLAAVLTLTACTPEKLGAWVRTQSGTIKDVSTQAQDAVELGKLTVEQMRQQAAEAASRAAQVKEGIEKIREGEQLVREGLQTGTGAGTSVSSR
ncbi:MAG: hypothetical protein PHW10_00035 [Candidatus Peribacteraceae bacterium]|nr:hypothetical protein [Candidatus Peribacteraceae bacterium]